MKTISKYIAVAAICASMAAPTVHAGSPLDALGALGGILSSVTSKTDFDLSELVGTWEYESPAVSLKSSNAASSIGGLGAGAIAENKLAPYYRKFKLDKAVLTVDADMNFTIKLDKMTLKGTIERDGDDASHLIFHFTAASKFNLGSVSALASKSSATKTLTITFDASRIIGILDKVSSFTNNSSLKAVSSIVNSYDGIYAGAKFKQK